MINEVFHEGIVVRTWKFADDLLFRLACHVTRTYPQNRLTRHTSSCRRRRGNPSVLIVSINEQEQPICSCSFNCFSACFSGFNVNGKEQTQWRRRQTLAMAAGLKFRRWTEKELLIYPLP